MVPVLGRRGETCREPGFFRAYAVRPDPVLLERCTGSGFCHTVDDNTFTAINVCYTDEIPGM